MSSKLAIDDWDDLSARSGGSGPLGGTAAAGLQLMFSSLVWEGWLRLGITSALGEFRDGLSATWRENHIEHFQSDCCYPNTYFAMTFFKSKYNTQQVKAVAPSTGTLLKKHFQMRKVLNYLNSDSELKGKACAHAFITNERTS